MIHPEPDDHLKAFHQSLGHLDELGGLFHAALLLSAVEFPNLERDWWQSWHLQLSDMVAQAAEFVLHTSDARGRLERLAWYFTNELHFSGNTENYSAPENSCLISVLTTRRGLPISLSVLLATIGCRMGLDLFGVGTPGHFLTGANLGERHYFMDPFGGADLLDEDQAAELVGGIVGTEAVHIHPFLRPMPPDAILQRMMNNLKAAYLNAGDVDKLIRAIDWILVAFPGNVEERRNRGLLLLRKGEYGRGALDLLEYLESDESSDAGEVRLIYEEASRALKEKRQAPE